MTRSIHEELESVPPALIRKPQWIDAVHQRQERTRSRRLWAGGGLVAAAAALFLVWSVDLQEASERPVGVTQEPSAVPPEPGISRPPSPRSVPASSNSSACEAKSTIEERNACYVRERARDLATCMGSHAGDATGVDFVRIVFDIDKGGEIIEVDLVPTSVKESALGSCLLKVAADLRFGPQEEATRFSIPLRIRR